MQVNSAIEPTVSATVSASAGTGKTWSLVSRIIRLLIAGAEPGNILAITFTRKAAAEMQARLNERLLELARCTPTELEKNLQLIGAPIDSESANQARGLYETILYTNHPPRITTFHAMCQELLKRFPFDANVPPGFELTEQTADLENEARDLLFTQATLENEGEIAQALETLFYYCGGLENTKLALDNFLNHRSDWWAFTLGQKKPAEYAIDKLKTQLGVDFTDDPVHAFFTQDILSKLGEFTELLSKHPIKKNQEAVEIISTLLIEIESKQYADAFSNLQRVFFTTTGSPRSRKASGAQQSKMGETGELRFLELHGFFIDEITALADKQAKLNTFLVSSAWYCVGQRLLQHYQTIKNEQRILDFADLEWNAFLLLSDENHATWIQYKLDSRINHVLIDEYQDTNPTQWFLLKPLLEEISSTNKDSNRSIFIVGDTKQSIYRFRRAQPKLFDVAQNWLSNNTECVNASLDLSRRSSPAIINFVNTIFADGILRDHIVNFEAHDTHLKNLWGKVTIPPLFMDDETDHPEEDALEKTFRNPLHTPYIIDEDQRRINEAQYIANEISTLMANKTIIGSEGKERYLNYSDIIILLGQRTHAGIYQKELNARAIPFIGINKGTLLETLEVKDLSALLNILVMPFDNLSLAQVLKSPIFNCSDQELLSLASLKSKPWFERLITFAEQNPNLASINRAVILLSGWKSAAGKLPVHDLLDKIISESNLINRYVSAYPGYLKHSVEANLNRFIELALEIDSGRYPSISRFLQRLNSLRDNQKDAPDELPAGKNTDRVRLLTIHAAKGLEAPVIFLADANSSPQNKQAYNTVVDWPAEAEKPASFLLALKKDDQDLMVKQIFTEQTHDIQREQANLLYVALTRAKQLLYVTGNKGKRDLSGLKWYDMIRSQLEQHSEIVESKEDGTLVIQRHQMPANVTAPDSRSTEPSADIPLQMTKPFSKIITELDLTPSSFNQQEPLAIDQWDKTESDNNAQLRGIIIHKSLQLLTESNDFEESRQTIQSLYQKDSSREDLDQYWQEAKSLIENKRYDYLFDNTTYEKAFNEVPVQYSHRHFRIHGIIDRLVVSADSVYIVDYKTAKLRKDAPDELSRSYDSQMSMYYHGIRKMWPDKSVVAQILHTYPQEVTIIEPVELELLVSNMDSTKQHTSN